MLTLCLRGLVLCLFFPGIFFRLQLCLVAPIEFLDLALDERLGVCYLLFDPLGISWQQFPGLVVLF
jgi:hypothetical protein